MNRRTFLAGWMIGALAMTPRIGRPYSGCGPVNLLGIQMCEVGLAAPLAPIAIQQMPEWCWAACIEAVFSYYGHYVPQIEIVRQTWGQIVNLPGQPQQIVSDLNRSWLDMSGVPFDVYGDVYSANVVTASQDLASNMPLIIGSMGHAMILTGLQWARDQFGRQQITAAIVRDPWPTNGIRRILTPQEWLSVNFLVRIRVA
jgi:hypothetical protein